MFENLNILSFGELLRKFVYSFQSRVTMSDNICEASLHNPQNVAQNKMVVILDSNLISPNKLQ